jgi:hypothetical protein
MRETILRMQQRTGPVPSVISVGGGRLQRKCACGDTPGPSGECEWCRKKKLQRKNKNAGVEKQNDSTAASQTTGTQTAHTVFLGLNR